MDFPFTRAEYRHVLLARVGSWCVVERTWVGDGKPHLPHFEVVKLQPARPRTLPDGRETLGNETYPPPTAWGRWGWSEPTLRHAAQRWAALAAKHELPEWPDLGLADDPEGYEAWKAGRLPRARS